MFLQNAPRSMIRYGHHCPILLAVIVSLLQVRLASAQCAPSWTRVPLPEARTGAAMAYDSGRGVLVAFGGRTSNNKRLNDTWEWNGTAWALRATVGPQPRVTAMAYDASRH